MYIVAPVMAFCNAYRRGVTDWSLASTYGKFAIFTIGAWAGGDFKTGYLIVASPRSMFVSQLIGTTMGCVIAPCVSWLFCKAFDDLGQEGSECPAPYALVYPILVNLIRDAVGKRRARFIPIPKAMAIPLYLGPYFAIDMCVGSLILFIWERTNKAKADAFGPAVASGLICGDGIWIFPSSILDLAGVSNPSI
ncbi:hypothetical protein AAG906_036831 [Vitis piasezkii]